ncbi:MAG: LysR family transcriptional regulator [Tepidisphaeraceae bacterium]|jgi:DNA-binding transcriptional LysR family regulator
MNLNHLAVFHAVAEEKSVTGAARRLLVSQPAISKQLRQFEKYIGIKLFERRSRGVRPTEAGTLLASYAMRVFALAEEAECAVGELRGLKRGRLRVGASTTVGVYLLPDVFVRFRAAYPGIQLQLDIAPSDTLAKRLRDGSLDIALTEGEIGDETLESTIIMHDKLVAIAPHNHPLARRRSVTAVTLCRQPFVVRETGSGTQSLVERTLAQRGITLNPAMSLGSTEAIKRAVASGVGVAIISGLAVALETQAKKLVVLRLSDLAISRPLHYVSARNSYLSHSILAFRKMVDDLISKSHDRYWK